MILIVIFEPSGDIGNMYLASIQKIHSFRNHTNAENLVCAKIKGWPVVVRKGDFKEGDLVVFITIDSIVPASNSYFSFMEKQKYRVWSAKFRGEQSQGLVCPLSLLPSGEWKEGDDCTEALGVLKYERPISLAAGDAKGNFPFQLIGITDEPNLLSYPEALDEFKGEPAYITQKQDGSSMTALYYNGELKVCSRRLELQESDKSIFWRTANFYNIPEKLKQLKRNLAIQAECCGAGDLCGNRLGLTRLDMFLFNAKDLDEARYFGYTELVNLARELEIPMVPVIYTTDSFDLTIDKLQEMANGIKYPNGKIGEGIVVRPMVYKHSYALNRMLSVKVINQEYKQ